LIPVKVLIIGTSEDYYRDLGSGMPFNGYDFRLLKPDADPKKVVGENPDIMILDMDMDGKSVMEMARKVKGGAGAPKIPVVAMSPYFIGEDIADYYGITDRIYKPFSSAEMIDYIDSITRSKHRAF
jgi:CheY-like chemotaxis protein